MVETISTELYKVVKFDYKYKIFNETSDLMPASFEFVTAEKNDFHYSWQVKYSSTTVWKSDLRVQDYDAYYDEMEEDAEFDDSAQDSTQQDIPARIVIHKVDVNSREKLNVGDTACVTIYVNGNICVNTEFDAENSLAFEKNVSPRLEVSNSDDPHFHVKIKIDHHCDRFSNQIVEDFSNFFENSSLQDVVFIINENEVSAHKQILAARNSVFRTMFESDMLERENGKVEIADIELNIFKQLLLFIYSGRVDSDDLEVWLKLIVAADKYSITSLVKICEKLISAHFTASNVIDVFAIADLVKAAMLKEKCIEFIHQNMFQVINSEAYKSLVKSNRADLISEILCYNLEKQ